MMAADTSKITVVCPTCGNKTEIPGEKKNTRIECPKCGSGFVAYEAVPCETCGKPRHPRHECWTCVPDNDLARKYRESIAGEALDRLPEDVRTVLKFESEKNAGLFEEMARRIEDLENRISDLESEIEELKSENREQPGSTGGGDSGAVSMPSDHSLLTRARECLKRGLRT